LLYTGRRKLAGAGHDDRVDDVLNVQQAAEDSSLDYRQVGGRVGEAQGADGGQPGNVA
jgi:hypothetical protein